MCPPTNFLTPIQLEFLFFFMRFGGVIGLPDAQIYAHVYVLNFFFCGSATMWFFFVN